MVWIKRNLFFLIGSLVAVGLMAAGIIFLLGQYNAEKQILDEIDKQYAELTRFAQLKPHPGNAKVDNIKAAKEQQALLRDYIKKERGFFQRIAPIPDVAANTKVSSADFARELRNTVSQLSHSAKQQGVTIPPDYYFTFESQKKSFKFDAGSLDKLAMHLGEINTLCEILFAAKINYLDSIQREIVSTNQDSNPSDYLTEKKTIIVPLADITPYQVTFRCFSADLAQVLSRLASSPYGFMVQSVNVEPVGSAAATATAEQLGVQPTGQKIPGNPPAVKPPVGTPGKPTAFLNEKPFRVTMVVQLVKPKPTK